MKKEHNKLVRDRIPEHIAADGHTCETEKLSWEAYLAALDAKLDEELAEYRRDRTLEELADLMEVIRACAAAMGHTPEELEVLRAEKARSRGGFTERIFLKSVTE